MICSYSSVIVLSLIFLVGMQSSNAIIWQNLVIADLYFSRKKINAIFDRVSEKKVFRLYLLL